MKRKKRKDNPFRPKAAGMGLIALDIVTAEGSEPRYFAGGTCGNVLAILSHLGWHSIPIARHAHDEASEIVRTDLKNWGVDLSFLHVEPLVDTPIVVERLEKDISGVPYHRFSFFCPGCNRRYPRFQPVPLKSLDEILPKLSDTSVFFVDRASAGSLAAAKKAADNGSVVFFEPPSANDDSNFRSMLATATVVKYSHDRIEELEIPRGAVRLEIQTLGRGGLRFRSKLGEFRNQWHHLHAEPKRGLIDSAGAGDWLSVGLMHALCKDGLAGLIKTKWQTLLRAFSFGQALAAWNCGFIGARGGMYGSHIPELNALVKEHSLHSHDSLPDTSLVSERHNQAEFCSGCKSSYERNHSDRLTSQAS